MTKAKPAESKGAGRPRGPARKEPEWYPITPGEIASERQASNINGKGLSKTILSITLKAGGGERFRCVDCADKMWLSRQAVMLHRFVIHGRSPTARASRAKTPAPAEAQVDVHMTSAVAESTGQLALEGTTPAALKPARKRELAKRAGKAPAPPLDTEVLLTTGAESMRQSVTAFIDTLTDSRGRAITRAERAEARADRLSDLLGRAEHHLSALAQIVTEYRNV